MLAWWVQTGKCTLSREKGREIGGSFLKTTRPKPRECPLAHPAEAQTGQPGPGSERGRAVPTRKEAGSRDSGTPRRCAARFHFSVNLPVSERRLSLRTAG